MTPVRAMTLSQARSLYEASRLSLPTDQMDKPKLPGAGARYVPGVCRVRSPTLLCAMSAQRPRPISRSPLSYGMEEKLAYLQMIQAVVTRMNSNSFLIKGWSITLVAALFVLAAAETNQPFVILAYFPAFMFWALDAYFMRQERLFRKLWDRARFCAVDRIDFSMTTKPFAKEVDSTWRVAWSPTLKLFHGTLAGTITIVMLVMLADQHLW